MSRQSKICRLIFCYREVISLPRAPSEKVKEAEKLYKSGKKLVDIADRLDIPAGTIRRWKSTYKWDSNNNERSDKIANVRNKNNERSQQEVKEVISDDELNDKQQQFCLFYVKSFNATKAYQKAYKCSYETAMVNGHKLLKNTKIKNKILELKQSKLNREFLSEEDIFQKYIDIAFADMTDYLEWQTSEVELEPGIVSKVSKVTFKDSSQIDGTLVSEVRVGKSGDAEIKLADRMKALNWLAEHMDMATEKQKAEIAVLRAKAQSDDTDEIEDDGFIEALNASAKEDWSDEESPI